MKNKVKKNIIFGILGKVDDDKGNDEERWKISLSNSPFVLGVVTLLKGRRELE